MSPYELSLAIGATGMVVMAARGLGHHTGSASHGGSHAGPASSHHGGQAGHLPHAAKLDGKLLSLLSPRVIFSFLVGFGATGILAASALSGPVLAAAAAAGGVGFERWIVAPIWNFLFRFESRAALTLESAVFDEARAVTDFDAEGQGLIAVDLDGQVVQLLGTLRPEDRSTGVKVRTGGRVRIEEVDPRRNRCVVSFLGE